LVSARLERALATPLVDVVTPKVHSAGLVLTAVEVVGQVISGLGVVVGRIADTEPAAKVLGLDVGLGVPDGGLDEGGGGGVGLVVGDLVAGEEADRVGELAEVVNDALVPGKEVRVPARVVALDRLARDAEVCYHVDARVGERVHAHLVVGLGVDGIHADSVGAQLLQEGDITHAACRVGQRVDERRLVGSLCCAARADALLVCYTLDEELCAVGRVEEILALMQIIRCGSKGSSGEELWAYLGDDGIYGCSRTSCQCGEDRRLGEAWKHFCSRRNVKMKQEVNLARQALACPQA
jgi:hypothetical protein